MLSIWAYAVVALLIAACGFVIGQFFPGMGVPFVALASTLWVAYSVRRQQRAARAR
jgi:hypothetical protein